MIWENIYEKSFFFYTHPFYIGFFFCYLRLGRADNFGKIGRCYERAHEGRFIFKKQREENVDGEHHQDYDIATPH